MNTRRIALAAAALAVALASGVAQARGPVDVQWSVNIAAPVLQLPGLGVVLVPGAHQPRYVVEQPRYVVEQPRYVVEQPRYVVEQPRYVVEQPYHYSGYRHPTRWDVDGDGIPNRYDRVYNPRWDRDGDGIPNRYDRDPRGHRDHHDGRRDWRDDRRR